MFSVLIKIITVLLVLVGGGDARTGKGVEVESKAYSMPGLKKNTKVNPMLKMFTPQP